MNDIVSIDLVEAAQRSDSFPQDWSQERLERAIDRYRKFLLLAAKHRGKPVAPTRDIDCIWHLHMLSPRAYYEDCQRLMGGILDHDGGFGKAPQEIPLLKATFEETARLWSEEYAEPYLFDASGDSTVNCWHDCQGRCWHACKSASNS